MNHNTAFIAPFSGYQICKEALIRYRGNYQCFRIAEAFTSPDEWILIPIYFDGLFSPVSEWSWGKRNAKQDRLWGWIKNPSPKKGCFTKNKLKRTCGSMATLHRGKPPPGLITCDRSIDQPIGPMQSGQPLDPITIAVPFPKLPDYHSDSESGFMWCVYQRAAVVQLWELGLTRRNSVFPRQERDNQDGYRSGRSPKRHSWRGRVDIT